jgi:hypothetical protein
MADTIEGLKKELDYKKLWEQEKKKSIHLEAKLTQFEQNGSAKLFYALNRKASEMADMLNKNILSSISIDDPKDKSFERLRIIWNDSAELSAAIKELGITAGVSGDEDKDLAKKPFVDTIAESRK